MNMSREGPKEIKYFNMKASDVVSNMLPMFEEQKVFLKVILKSGIDKMKDDIEMQLKLGPLEAINSAKNQILNPILPPSGIIHYFRWGTQDVYQLVAPPLPQQFQPGTEGNPLQTVHLQWAQSRPKPSTPFPYFMSQIQVLRSDGDSGVYLLGGQQEESEQYTNQVLYFQEYNQFIRKTGMRCTRAFFPTVHYDYDNSLFVFGGRNTTGDLAECEKYNVLMNRWFSITPMPTARNGSSAIVID